MRSCPTMRRKLVVTKWLCLRTGEITGPESAKWVTEPCNTPLFSDDGDLCRGCLRGWWHPHNYPVSLASEMEQPCPSLTARPQADVEAEYDNIYIAHFGADRKAAA